MCVCLCAGGPGGVCRGALIAHINCILIRVRVSQLSRAVVAFDEVAMLAFMLFAAAASSRARTCAACIKHTVHSSYLCAWFAHLLVVFVAPREVFVRAVSVGDVTCWPAAG